PAEIMNLNRQENKIRMATAKESDDMKKPSKVQTKDTAKVSTKTIHETSEGHAAAELRSAANDSMGAEEIAKAVLTAKESGSLSARIVKARAAKEGKPGVA